MSPLVLRLLIRGEYAALCLLVAALGWMHQEEAGWLFWLFLILPDVPMLLALLPGERLTMRRMPRRVVPFYNATHNLLLPLALGAGLWLASGAVPWYVAGWFLHVGVDRALGFGLRARDGQVSGLPA